MLSEPLAVTLLVSEALETLGVAYFVGGSLASALHGVLRATLDADVIADLRGVSCFRRPTASQSVVFASASLPEVVQLSVALRFPGA